MIGNNGQRARPRDFIERRLTLVTCGVAAGVLGGFLLLKVM